MKRESILNAMNAIQSLEICYQIPMDEIVDVSLLTNPLTGVPFIRFMTKNKELIIWDYTILKKIVRKDFHRTYRFKMFHFSTFDEEVMTINVLFDLGYRVREIAAFTGYAPSTVTRRRKAMENKQAFPTEVYQKFKQDTFVLFEK